MSLGHEFAENYDTFEVDTSKVKRSVKLKMSTATKKELGLSFGEAIMQCSSRMFCHIFSVVSLEKMCSLKKELVFIQKLLNKYANFCGSLQHNIYNFYCTSTCDEMKCLTFCTSSNLQKGANSTCAIHMMYQVSTV